MIAWFGVLLPSLAIFLSFIDKRHTRIISLSNAGLYTLSSLFLAGLIVNQISPGLMPQQPLALTNEAFHIEIGTLLLSIISLGFASSVFLKNKFSSDFDNLSLSLTTASLVTILNTDNIWLVTFCLFAINVAHVKEEAKEPNIQITSKFAEYSLMTLGCYGMATSETVQFSGIISNITQNPSIHSSVFSAILFTCLILRVTRIFPIDLSRNRTNTIIHIFSYGLPTPVLAYHLLPTVPTMFSTAAGTTVLILGLLLFLYQATVCQLKLNPENTTLATTDRIISLLLKRISQQIQKKVDPLLGKIFKSISILALVGGLISIRKTGHLGSYILTSIFGLTLLMLYLI